MDVLSLMDSPIPTVTEIEKVTKKLEKQEAEMKKLITK